MLIIVCLILIGYSGWNIYTALSNYKEGADEYEQVRKQFKSKAGQDEGSQTKHRSITKTSYCHPENFYVNGYLFDTIIAKKYTFDFSALLSKNRDVQGWISIEGTNIDYSIVQGVTNEEYLRHTIEHTFNNAGSIFLNSQVKRPFEELNTIIYGHNQRNGMIFHDLMKYKEESFYKEHPYIEIYTPDRTYVYQVCSAYITNAFSDTYLLERNRSFTPERFLNQMMQSALYDTGAMMTQYDTFLTLSTCTNNAEEERMVVHAKRLGIKEKKFPMQTEIETKKRSSLLKIVD